MEGSGGKNFGYNFRVILTGWKEIARHLRYGVRTLQRWESNGLPVRRVNKDRRSPVVADSEELDAWILHRSHIPPNAPQDLMSNLRRARELRIQIQQNREEFQQRVKAFHAQLAEFREKRKKRLAGAKDSQKARPFPDSTQDAEGEE